MSRVEAIKNILKNSDVLENEALKKYRFYKNRRKCWYTSKSKIRRRFPKTLLSIVMIMI